MTRLFSRLLLALALLGTIATQAQNTAGYGDWQLHLPTTHPLRLADAGNRLYVVTDNAFYFLDKSLNTTQVLSSRDGLHDVGASVAAYDAAKKQTVVVYRNGNMDVIKANGSVQNIGDVLRKTVQGTRTIYDLALYGRRGYISTSFGVIVLNLDKLEISDTYTSIGPAGEDVEVYAAAVLHDSLFVGTSKGLQVGRLRDNLLDYRSWTRPTFPPAGLASCRQMAVYNNRVYTAANGGGVYIYQRLVGPGRGIANAWYEIYGGYAGTINRLKDTADGLLVASDAYGLALVKQPISGRFAELFGPAAPNDRIQDFVRQDDGSYFVANYATGLQHVRVGAAGTIRDNYVANGPQTSQAFGILADSRSGIVDVFTGGYNSGYVPFGYRAGYYEHANGQWTNFTLEAAASSFPNLRDQVRGARAADGTLYVGTFRDGLLQRKPTGEYRVFNDQTTPELKLRDRVPGYVQIPDVAVAADGKVWVVNYHKQDLLSGLLVYDPEADVWATVPPFLGSESLERIAIDNSGQVWVTGAGKGSANGAYVVDPTGGNSKRFATNTGAGADIYDIVKDRRGDIWVATTKGVAVLNDPSGAFTGTSSFRTPIVRRGDGMGFPALFSDAVKCAAVDGDNRKWFGTDNGIWLFSEDADEALLHFTTANSPLPSNRINDVDVNNKTGEVWIATDAGVVSYRGSASVTEGDPDCTKVFPNPVRPDFNGTMGITGVANNAQVKITDVAGHLVYATTASGGTVTWNLNDATGQRIKSGVYLVLTADADGKNTCVSKVAVLR